MILVLCSAQIDPEKQEAYLEAVRATGAVEATHTEPGNISYDLVCSATERGKMLMIERWADMPSLREHTTGENFRALGVLGAEYGVKSEIKLFNAEAIN